jgi:uncharacterized damage-inducible protein DinB
MAPHDRYRQFAAYNAWANTRLYDAVAALPEADFHADRGAFFRSLKGTLNHILVGDRIWFGRLTGEGPAYTQLDLILHEDLAGLRRAREAEDARITAYVDSLDEAALNQTLEYRTTTGQPFVQTRSSVLDHVFNHQTHHRGQAHALISAAGASPPSLDLLGYQRAFGVSVGA